MAHVLRTLAGDISPAEVGGMLPHEHITVDLTPIGEGGNRRPERALVWEPLLQKLQALRAAGVDTLVECTPPHLGRDVDLMRELGAASDIRVLTPTGLYREAWQPDERRAQDVAALAAWMEQELTEGIAGSQASARAGFIKLGCSDDAVYPHERKAMQAGARASRTTGAAMMCHCGVGARALEVVEIIQQAGADPDRLIIAHADNEPAIDLIVQVARRGSYVEFDHIGGQPDAPIIERVQRLAAAGLLDRVLLSQDVCGHFPGREPGGDGRPYTYLHQRFVPSLRQAGFSADELRQLTLTNPVQALQMPAD